MVAPYFFKKLINSFVWNKHITKYCTRLLLLLELRQIQHMQFKGFGTPAWRSFIFMHVGRRNPE